MALNQLVAFLEFNVQAFFIDKLMMIKSILPMKVYDGKKAVGTQGTKIGAVIISDKTKYPNDDPNMRNAFSSFNLKLPDVDVDTVREQLHIGDQFKLTGCTKASVYGDYKNELSISAKLSDIKKVVKK